MYIADAAIGNNPIMPRLFAINPNVIHAINRAIVIFVVNLFLYANISRTSAIELVVNAEKVTNAIFDSMHSITSNICHISRPDVVFLNTEIPRQIAAKSENMFPRIKYVCILFFLFRRREV